MKTRRIFLIFIVLIVASLCTWNIFFDHEDEAETVAKTITELNVLDHSYDEFIRFCFKKGLTDMKMTADLNLNGPYQKEKLNVYVVNFRLLGKTKKIANLTTKEFSSVIKGNFIV